MMKKFTLLLLISKFLAGYCALASKIGEETGSVVHARNRSVREKVRMFEEINSIPTSSLSKSSEPQKSNETISSSPGHVRKISKIFQRSKSMEQLPKVSRIQKSSPSTGASASAIIPSPSPKSPRNLFRLLRSRESVEDLPNNKINKSQKGSKGSRSKSAKNTEISAPSINTVLTKQHNLSPETIEKDWEDRIRYFNMVKRTIEEHISSGTINEENEKYNLVLKGDLAQLEEMYIRGMSYLHGKHSIRRHDPMMVASHLQNMKNLLDIVGSEIYWVAGEGKLTISQLTLFETKLLDAKQKSSIVNKSSETPELLQTCITHPSRKRAHTTKG
ncbi:hypothetical protein IM40_11125 (plasmid) [Candidatus Paracaedimonas acanthamoebae]|nr:hypothetical protein IM40_11125 [Candidatus Paracaedimonas acanthamoebae]